MSSSDTTSIHDLPADPASGGSGNVNFSINEIRGSDTSVAEPVAMLNQIVGGLQRASSAGLTQLPSRDIPTMTQGYTQDAQIQPDYIPATQNADYIRDHEENEDIISQYNKKASHSNRLDDIYDEIQTPLLIGVLFFLFQLPVFKRFLFTYFPVLFFKDGNINIYGYTFQSFLFGLVYYLVFKVMNHFGKF